jgi:hypothetical protein
MHAFGRTNPQAPISCWQEHSDFGVKPVTGELVLTQSTSFNPIQAGGGANPNAPMRVLHNGTYFIPGQAIRLGEMGYPALAKPAYAVISADPEAAVTRFTDCPRWPVRQTLIAIRHFHFGFPSVEQTRILRSNPKSTVPVLSHR